MTTGCGSGPPEALPDERQMNGTLRAVSRYRFYGALKFTRFGAISPLRLKKTMMSRRVLLLMALVLTAATAATAATAFADSAKKKRAVFQSEQVADPVEASSRAHLRAKVRMIQPDYSPPMVTSRTVAKTKK